MACACSRCWTPWSGPPIASAGSAWHGSKGAYAIRPYHLALRRGVLHTPVQFDPQLEKVNMQVGILTAPFGREPLLDVVRWAGKNGIGSLEVAVGAGSRH